MKLKPREAKTRAPRQRPRVTLSCIYCHDRLHPPERAFCASCLAPHHRECFEGHGGCSASGCAEDELVLTRPKTRRRRRKPGAARRKKVEELALLSLVLGVVALMACGLIAPFAIAKANEARRLAARLRLPAPAFATGGLLLGWLSLVGLVLGLIYLLLVVAVFLS